MTDKPEKSSPPIISYKTFTNFLKSLSTTAVPASIDRSIMAKMSGITQNQTLSALRFLRCIGPNGVVQHPLHNLVKAFGTESWSSVLTDVISDAYVEIVDGLDLDNGTASQLAFAFKKRGGVDGQMLSKAVRFYLKAMTDAGLTYSPHFKAPPAPRKPKSTRAKVKGSEDGNEIIDDQPEDNTPIARGMTLVPIGGGRNIAVEKDLTDDDVDVIETLIPALRAMAKRHTKGGAP
jgi:hypothetical protein